MEEQNSGQPIFSNMNEASVQCNKKTQEIIVVRGFAVPLLILKKIK